MKQLSSPSSAHTPGPWSVGYSENEDVYDSERHLCILGDPEKQPGIIADLETLREADANACLIAAAPELLDALKMVYDIALELDAFEGDYYGSEISHIEGVIAKAEGRDDAEMKAVGNLKRPPTHRILIMVSSGVAEYATDRGVDVCLLDFDNDPDSRIPDEYADLALMILPR